MRDHLVCGDMEKVEKFMRAAQARGDLVSYGTPQRVGVREVEIMVTLVDRRVVRRATQGGPSLRVIAVVAGVGMAVVAGLGLLAWAVVEFVVSHAALLIGGAAVAVLAALVVLRVLGGGGCMGIHCPGCGHR